jgi:hypothetical protein
VKRGFATDGARMNTDKNWKMNHDDTKDTKKKFGFAVSFVALVVLVMSS